MLSIWDKGQTGAGRRQLVVMYLVRSGEGSVIGQLWERTRRGRRGGQKNNRLDKDKNRRLGPGRVPIKGPAFPPLLPLFFSLDMKSDFFYLS